MSPPPVGSVVASTMLLLPSDKMTDLRNDFKANQNGLTLHQFVSTMIRHTLGETASEEKKIDLVADLCELFAQVDVNGDGTMDWEEFTRFMIEQAFAIGQEETFYDRYEERGGEGIGISVGRNVTMMKYLIDQHKLFVAVEGRLRVLDVNNSKKTVIGEIDTGQRLPDLLPNSSITTGKSKNAVGGTVGEEGKQASLSPEIKPTSSLKRQMDRRGKKQFMGKQGKKVIEPTALDLVYIQEEDLYCVILNDISIAFFTREFYHLAGKVDTGNTSRKDPLTAVGQQYCGAWAAQSRLLFTSGAAPLVFAWALTHDPELKQHGLMRMHTLSRHTDIVQSLMVVTWDDNSMLISASLDRRIHLWTTDKPTWQGQRCGHKGGIRTLAYDSGEGLLLSAGFEHDILVWDIWGTLPHPLLRLVGHRSPVLSVQCAADTGRAASLDEAGHIIWWDIRRAGGVEYSSRCLQNIDLKLDKCHKLALIFGTDAAKEFSSNGVTIATIGRKLHLHDCNDSRPPEPPLAAVLYNATSLTFATANGRDLKVWDAGSRTMLRWYENLAPSEITSISFDGRQRKIIIATQDGQIGVYNYLNGALMKALPQHKKEISSLIYAVEDKCIITGSWDRSLHIYDEICKVDEEPLLRTVTHAHSGDIISLAFNYDLSLLASGSSDGSLKVWDFQFMYLDGDCTSELGDVKSEIMCIEFVDPYPLLLCANAASTISFIPVRPYFGDFHRYSVMGSFRNYVGEGKKNAAPITVMKVVFTPGGGGKIHSKIEKPRFLVYTGNENGEIYVWDISLALEKLKMRSVPDKDLPPRMGSYNPHRRTTRDNKNYGAAPTRGKSRRVRTRERHLEAAFNLDNLSIGEENDDDNAEWAFRATFAPLADAESVSVTARSTQSERTVQMVGPADVLLMGEWIGHHGQSIKSLEIVSDNLLVTGAADRSVKLWRFDGLPGGKPILQGILTLGIELDVKFQVKNWDFPIDFAARQQEQLRSAEEILQKVRQMEDEDNLAKSRTADKKTLRKILSTTPSKPIEFSEGKDALMKFGRNLEDLMRSEDLDGFSERTKESIETADSWGEYDDVTPDTLEDAIKTLGIEHSPAETKDLEQKRERILDQLEGKQTWTKSQWEIAREEALKTQEEVRLKREKISQQGKRKKKRDSRRDSVLSDLNAETTFTDTKRLTASERRAEKEQLHQFDPDPTDPDNWHISSHNRQREMYKHLYNEFARNETKEHKLRGEYNQIKRLAKPSAFLLQQMPELRTSSIDRRATRLELRRRAKARQKSLESSRSNSALLKRDPVPAAMKAKELGSSRSSPALPVALPSSRSKNRSAPDSMTMTQFPPISENRSVMTATAIENMGRSTIRPKQQQARHQPPSSPIETRSGSINAPIMTMKELQSMGRRQADIQQRWQQKIESFVDMTERLGILKDDEGMPQKRMSKGRTIKGALQKRALAVVHLNDLGHEARHRRLSLNSKKQKLLSRSHFGPYHKQELHEFYQAFRAVVKPGQEEEIVDVHALLHAPLIKNNKKYHTSVRKMLLDPAIRRQGATIHFDSAITACFPLLRKKEKREFVTLMELFYPKEEVEEVVEEVEELPPEKLEEMKMLFDMYDEDKGGTVDVQEIKNALTSGSNEDAITEAEINQIMAQFDGDGNSELDFEEFVMAFKDVF